MIHTIDAKNKKLGRIATEAASILIGKHSTSFARNKVHEDTVHIINASKVDMSDAKLKGIVHTTYSGHPGGLYQTKGDTVVEQKGYAELFRHAIKGMLPKNKLQTEMMKKLTISE